MNADMHIEHVLEQEGVFVSTTSGVSMRPLFKHRRDTIVIVKPSGRLHKYDVPLYRSGDRYLLHRIIQVLPDSYVICGDNCLNKEYGITDADIVGVLKEFYRKNKHYTVENRGYRLYARIWVAIYPLRIFVKWPSFCAKQWLQKRFPTVFKKR